jgi:hypothetical protein
MDANDDYETTKRLWEVLNGNPIIKYHEAYMAQYVLIPKWLVYAYHLEDWTFMPIAIVEAKDEDEACSIVEESDISMPEDLRPLQARRFTRDDPDAYMPKVIECVECGHMKKSFNGVFCPSCLDSFMGFSLDGIDMIRK